MLIVSHNHIMFSLWFYPKSYMCFGDFFNGMKVQILEEFLKANKQSPNVWAEEASFATHVCTI